MKKSKKAIIFLIVLIVAILVAVLYYLVSSGFIQVTDNVEEKPSSTSQTVVEEFKPDEIGDITSSDKTLDYTSTQSVHSESLGQDLDLIFPEFTPRVKPRSASKDSTNSDSGSSDSTSYDDSDDSDGNMISEGVDLLSTNLDEVERHAMMSTNKTAISYGVGSTQHSTFVALDNGFSVDVYLDSAEVNEIDEKQMLYCILDEYSYAEPNVLEDGTIQTYFTYKNNFGVGTMYICGASNNLSILSTFKYDNGHVLGIKGNSESYSIIMQYITDIIENGILFW